MGKLVENTKSIRARKAFVQVSVLLGFLGAVNSTVIGFYLLSTLLDQNIMYELKIHAYIISPIIAAITIMLIFGSYLIVRNKSIRKGSRVNIVAGLFLAFLYVYYSCFSQPLLLGWLFPYGIILVIPPILSGILVEIAPK
jgi:MFS family permease